jgi:hypothetical protein
MLTGTTSKSEEYCEELRKQKYVFDEFALKRGSLSFDMTMPYSKQVTETT